MIWYNFGSGVEETGKSGLAHFMEHLMFKGTKKFPESYYSDFISKIGGEVRMHLQVMIIQLIIKFSQNMNLRK